MKAQFGFPAQRPGMDARSFPFVVFHDHRSHPGDSERAAAQKRGNMTESRDTTDQANARDMTFGATRRLRYAELRAGLVLKNAPHWWISDRLTGGFGVDETSVGGIGFRIVARLPAFIAKSGKIEPPSSPAPGRAIESRPRTAGEVRPAGRRQD